MAKNVAILFAHPDQSQPLLRGDPRLEAALILGLMGCRDAAPVLAKAVRESAWDTGWDFLGMGQWGASLSRLDVMILALARTGDPVGQPVIEEKIRQLDERAPFSHCRVVSEATVLLPELAGALADLLQRPGMTGQAQLDTATVIQTANGDLNEAAARTLSLRELHLARGLFLAGDRNGLGKKILETYTRDLRGHYARHARAVLKQKSALAMT